MAEFDRIVQQVVENLLDLVYIGEYIHLVAGQYQFDGDGPFAAGALKGGGHIADHAVDIKIGFVQHNSLGIQIVERQQAVGQLCQALRFI